MCVYTLFYTGSAKKRLQHAVSTVCVLEREVHAVEEPSDNCQQNLCRNVLEHHRRQSPVETPWSLCGFCDISIFTKNIRLWKTKCLANRVEMQFSMTGVLAS